MQRVEKHDASSEQFVVFVSPQLQTVDQQSDRERFARLESAVLEIQVVDDLGHPGHCPIADSEVLAQRLERAVCSVMAELHAKHVEGDRVDRSGGRVRYEGEPCAGIDEPPDEPRGRHPIDTGSGPRDPERATRLFPGVVSRLDMAGPSTALSLLARKLIDEDDHAIAAGAAEEIHPVDRRYALPESLEQSWWRRTA